MHLNLNLSCWELCNFPLLTKKHEWTSSLTCNDISRPSNCRKHKNWLHIQSWHMLLTVDWKNIFWRNIRDWWKNADHFTLCVDKFLNHISNCMQLYSHILFHDEILFCDTIIYGRWWCWNWSVETKKDYKISWLHK